MAASFVAGLSVWACSFSFFFFDFGCFTDALLAELLLLIYFMASLTMSQLIYYISKCV